MAQYSIRGPWAADPWQEFEQLRRNLDSVVRRLSEPPRRGAWGRGVFPAVNLYETEEGYVLTAELPGVAPGDISLSLEGSTVTLSGERRIEYAGERTSLHRRERQSGSFRRAFELPARIDADKVEAVHRNGVLMLRMPKTPDAQPRPISVRAG